MEDTKTTIIVCHESGEQFVPLAWLAVYVRPDGEIEGLWRSAEDSTTFQYLLLHARLLKGASESLETLILELLEKKEKREGTREDADA